MANTIALFKKYIDKLDEVYKRASLSAVLDSNPADVTQGAAANEYIIPKMDMQGLGNYDRNSGYVSGDVTLTHETVKAEYDRGRKFSVDALDDEETAGLAFGRLAAEFMRTKVVPEVDAYRFAKISTVGTKKEESLASGDAVVAALRVASNAMDEKEVPLESRYLFITPTLLHMVEDLDTTKSRAVLKDFNGRIIEVPQSRFYTAVKLNSGKSLEAAGGYTKDPSGHDINFMVVEKTAVIQFAKHKVSKIFRPEENQDADAWVFNYRENGLTDVYENKADGVYTSHVGA